VIIIKALEKKIIENIKFQINPCLEFACALRTVGKKEELLKMAREMNFNINNKDKEMLDKLEKGISKYIRSEMEYFFEICSIEVLIAAFVADYDNFRDVQSLLNFIENTNETILFKYLGGVFIFEQLPKFNLEWDSAKDDLGRMREYVESSEIQQVEIKERLLECFNNPEETKQRLCFLFRQFYDKAYKPLEEVVLQEIENTEVRYRELMNRNPQEFVEKYFFNFFKVEEGNWEFQFTIHISLLLQAYFWNINLHDYRKEQGWVILGARVYEFYFDKEAKDRVDRFLKVLSDKRRIDIIKLLSYKPYYGYEIAAKLSLTPATVNYHMGFLMDAKIISFDREENKVYYSLNKDKIRELLNETGSILLNE
jgi:DNA-binding transcriptional ArsR family regulator